VKRIITTVGFGTRQDVGKPGEESILGTSFAAKVGRFETLFKRYVPEAELLTFRDCLPPGSPTHAQKPYAFKVYAILEAFRRGADTVLWADASVCPLNDFQPLWDIIDNQGYWLSKNGANNCGEWCSDAALPILGINRQWAYHIPQIWATSMGFHRDSITARSFLCSLECLARTDAFCGPWVNTHGEASSDPRVSGHRHDQTAASVIADRLGMTLTPQQDIIDKVLYLEHSDFVRMPWRGKQ